jgi:hypothetical protein
MDFAYERGKMQLMKYHVLFVFLLSRMFRDSQIFDSCPNKKKLFFAFIYLFSGLKASIHKAVAARKVL